MQFGRTQQIVALTVVWAAALIGADRLLGRAAVPVAPSSGQPRPQIVVTFTHFCCTGCYDKMFSAAKALSWIVTVTTDPIGLKRQEDLQTAKVDPASEIETTFQKDASLLLDSSDLKSVDLVRVHRTFRDAGLTPRHMLLENIPHFRLVAVDPHLCCGLCESAATNSMRLEQLEQQVQARVDDPTLSDQTVRTRIMPAFEVDRPRQRVTAEYYGKADVTRFQVALERAGFSPREVRIEILGGVR